MLGRQYGAELKDGQLQVKFDAVGCRLLAVGCRRLAAIGGLGPAVAAIGGLGRAAAELIHSSFGGETSHAWRPPTAHPGMVWLSCATTRDLKNPPRELELEPEPEPELDYELEKIPPETTNHPNSNQHPMALCFI